MPKNATESALIITLIRLTSHVLSSVTTRPSHSRQNPPKHPDQNFDDPLAELGKWLVQICSNHVKHERQSRRDDLRVQRSHPARCFLFLSLPPAIEDCWRGCTGDRQNMLCKWAPYQIFVGLTNDSRCIHTCQSAASRRLTYILFSLSLTLSHSLSFLSVFLPLSA